MWNFIAHLLIEVKSLWRPVHLWTRPRESSKNEFSGRNSQGIYPNLEYFEMILKALQTLLFKIKIHPLVKKTPKSSEFSLYIMNTVIIYES